MIKYLSATFVEQVVQSNEHVLLLQQKKIGIPGICFLIVFVYFLVPCFSSKSVLISTGNDFIIPGNLTVGGIDILALLTQQPVYSTN